MNPQLENGYTRIANELLTELIGKIHLSGNEWKILLTIIRKTYGFQKKEDKISLTQFQKLTGISRPSVVEAISKLVGKNLLVVKKELLINVYSFNKNHSTWITSRDKGTSREKSTSRVFGKQLVGKKEPELVGKKEHTKETIKETITKEIKATAVADTLNQLIQLFKRVNPNYNLLFERKTQRDPLQRHVDKFTYGKIENLLNMLPEINAKPYAPRITTPIELENNMGKLIIFLNQEKNIKREVVDARGI